MPDSFNTVKAIFFNSFFLIFFILGIHPTVLSDYFRLCAQKSRAISDAIALTNYFWQGQELYAMPGIKPRSIVHKVDALPSTITPHTLASLLTPLTSFFNKLFSHPSHLPMFCSRSSIIANHCFLSYFFT